MKSGIALGIILLLIGCCYIPVTAQPHQRVPSPLLRGGWLYVGGTGPGNYTKIQDAVDNASSGDTVFVYSGRYPGYVICHTAINLIGEDKNTTIIDGYFAFTIYIVTDWVNVSGFTIYTNGRGEGIRIDSSHNTFTNTTIDAPRDRIRIAGNNNTFTENTIRNCYLYLSGNDNIISDNTVTNTYYGLFLSGYAAHNLIANNAFTNSGLFISDSTVLDNTVTNNTVNGKPLAYLHEKSDTVFDAAAGQVLLVDCTNVTVQDQDIHNTMVGIQVWGSTHCRISDSIITGSHFGVYVYGWNNTIRNNTIMRNAFGAYLSGDSDTIANNTIVKNMFSNNSDSIYQAYCDHSSISHNTFTDNANGILINFGSRFNTIANNTLTRNEYGIYITDDSNTICNNNLSSNHHGIHLFSSDSNVISHNRIIDNDGNGLHLQGDDNSVFRNTISGNHDGIYLIHSSHNLVSNNSIAKNTNGILLNDSNHVNRIEDNNVTDNSRAIISLAGNTDTMISGNTIEHNDEGILVISNHDNITKNTIAANMLDGVMLSGDNNTVDANTISNNLNGISLDQHKNNRITGNTIVSNNDSAIFLNGSTDTMISGNIIRNNRQGVYLVSSFKNSILGNSFQGNKRHALFENCTNLWDGNYWGRPRFFPKLIFGVRTAHMKWSLPLIDIDRHPAISRNPHSPLA